MGIDHKKELLKNQFAWQDFFAKSIYKQNLKDKTVNLYPESYTQIEDVKIDKNKLWVQNEFYGVIGEWFNEIPKLKFMSIGNYLLFVKSIFCKEYQIGIESINSKRRPSSEEMKIKMNQLSIQDQDLDAWKAIEKYFYIKGIEIMNRQ